MQLVLVLVLVLLVVVVGVNSMASALSIRAVHRRWHQLGVVVEGVGLGGSVGGTPALVLM